MRYIIDIFLVIGAVFALAGTIGVIKMPDLFSRMQASTCITTLGILGIGVAGVLYAACIMHSGATAVKVALITLLVITVNPVGGHALMKGAYRAGFRPEKEMKVDDFRRDFDE